MGRIIDFLLSGNWEEFQRIQLYKKFGNKLDKLPPDKLEQIKEILEEKWWKKIEVIQKNSELPPIEMSSPLA